MIKLIKIGIASILLLLPAYIYFKQEKKVEEYYNNAEIEALEKEIEIKEAVLSAIDEESKSYLEKAESGKMDKDNADMMIELNADKKKNIIIHVQQAKKKLEELKKEKKTEPGNGE